MRDNDVREIALRASDLSPAALKMIRNLIEDTRRSEGLGRESLASLPAAPSLTPIDDGITAGGIGLHQLRPLAERVVHRLVERHKDAHFIDLNARLGCNACRRAGIRPELVNDAFCPRSVGVGRDLPGTGDVDPRPAQYVAVISLEQTHEEDQP